MKKIISELFKASNAPRLLWVLFFLIILFVYNQEVEGTKFIQDDAFTSLKYVTNFVEGRGLVFNSGECVEGYTNFLWVMILSAITFCTKLINPNLSLTDFLPGMAQLLSIFSGVLFLLVVYLLSKKIIRDEKENSFVKLLAPIVPVVMTLYTTPFIYWSVSGMETSLFAFLTLLSILFYINFDLPRGRTAFTMISLLNSFLRPEGVIFFLLLMLIRLITQFISADENKIFTRIKNAFTKEIISILGMYFLPIIAFELFRLIYYGYPFPNTFYAKTEFSIQFFERGLNYFISFAGQNLFYGLFILPVIIQFVRKKISYNEIVIFYFSLIWIMLVIAIGGDVLPINRFFLPILPLLFILLINSCIKLLYEFTSEKFRTVSISILFGILIFFSFYNYGMHKPEMMEKRAYETGLVSKMKIYAEFIKEKQSNSKIKVAMSTIGAFSFYSGAGVLDIVGLTNEYIAHHPVETDGIDEQLPVLWKERHYNAGYVMATKPDFIVFPAGAKPSAFAECALFVQPEFYKDYYTQIFYSEELQQFLPIFTRKENVRSDSIICDNSFLKYYIDASNKFLKMIETKNRKMISEIVSDLDQTMKICPTRISEANTLKGMAFYHLRNNIIAEKYLVEAAQKDSTNSIAQFYLMNIYRLEGRELKAISLIPKIKRFSPAAFPKLFPN